MTGVNRDRRCAHLAGSGPDLLDPLLAVDALICRGAVGKPDDPTKKELVLS